MPTYTIPEAIRTVSVEKNPTKHVTTCIQCPDRAIKSNALQMETIIFINNISPDLV